FSIPAIHSNRRIEPNPGRFSSVTPLLEPAIPARFGQHSDRIRTPFPTQSDSLPKHLGHHSDGAPKTVRFPPEHCPDSIGKVSGVHRNAVRLHVGPLSDLCRDTQGSRSISFRASRRRLS